MTDSDLGDRITPIEQRLHRHDQIFAQIDEILLRITQRQEINAQQIARNSEDIAALRTLIEMQTGNG